MREHGSGLRDVDTPPTPLPGASEFHDLCDAIVARVTGAVSHRHESTLRDPDDAEFFAVPDAIIALQQETPAAAHALFCEHCVSGGRYGPDFKHLLDNDEPLEDPPELTLEQVQENARRLGKADDRNSYRRRKIDRNLKRRR